MPKRGRVPEDLKIFIEDDGLTHDDSEYYNTTDIESSNSSSSESNYSLGEEVCPLNQELQDLQGEPPASSSKGKKRKRGAHNKCGTTRRLRKRVKVDYKLPDPDASLSDSSEPPIQTSKLDFQSKKPIGSKASLFANPETDDDEPLNLAPKGPGAKKLPSPTKERSRTAVPTALQSSRAILTLARELEDVVTAHGIDSRFPMDELILEHERAFRSHMARAQDAEERVAQLQRVMHKVKTWFEKRLARNLEFYEKIGAEEFRTLQDGGLPMAAFVELVVKMPFEKREQMLELG